MVLFQTYLEVSRHHEAFILWVLGLEDFRRQTHLAKLSDCINELIGSAGELSLEEGEPENPGLM